MDDADQLADLKALAGAVFPKRCACCGRVYADADEFLRETRRVQASSKGLKAATWEDGARVLEVFRNCTCGSTLMELFGDRRDTSPAGECRRKQFAELLRQMVDGGADRVAAKRELLELMHGRHRELPACKTIPR